VDEERLIYVALIVIAVPVLAIQLVTHARFGTEATLALAMAVLGTTGLVRAVGNSLLPTARIRRTTSRT